MMKNVLAPLNRSFFIPLGLTAVTSTADARFHKNILRSGTTTLIISNKEMKDVIEIVKPLEDSGLLIKDFTQTLRRYFKMKQIKERIS